MLIIKLAALKRRKKYVYIQVNTWGTFTKLQVQDVI
jgi:hypothetical protein